MLLGNTYHGRRLRSVSRSMDVEGKPGQLSGQLKHVVLLTVLVPERGW